MVLLCLYPSLRCIMEHGTDVYGCARAGLCGARRVYYSVCAF